MKTFNPLPAQIDCAEFMVERPASGAFLDMGEGKTSISCMVVQALKQANLFNGCIVVTTKEIMDLNTWPNEFKKWGWPYTYTILHGKDKDKNLKLDVDFYIINFEGLHWLLQNISKLKADMLIIDESDKAKGFKTNRFKIFKKMVPYFQRRHLLTGTPTPQGYMDLFSQIYILDQGERLGRYITHYRNEYFYPTGYKGYQYVLQEDGAERINEAIKDIIYRPHKNSVKLPPPNFIDVKLKLSKKLRADYNELEEEFILEKDKGVITAVHSAAKRLKLKQFCNGSVYDEDGKVLHIHNLKINALKKVIKELDGEPLLIGYEFKHDLVKLRKLLPDAPFFGTTIDGKKPKKDKKLRIQKMWNAGKLPFLIGQISSVARGLNIQEGGFNIFLYSHLDKFSDVLQFIARLRRSGQKKRVNVWRPYIDDSVDENIIYVNQQGKDETQKSFLNAMRKRVVKRKKK